MLLKVNLEISGPSVQWGGIVGINVRHCDPFAHGVFCVLTGVWTGADYVTDQWLRFSVDGAVDFMGRVSLGMAVQGMWENAFGMPTIGIGQTWARTTIDTPMCVAAIINAIATSGIGAVAVLEQCFIGVGLGGRAVGGPIQGEFNGYFSIRMPDKFFANIKANDVGFQGIARWMFEGVDQEWVGDVISTAGLLGNFDQVFLSAAMFSGQMGLCPDAYPICVKFDLGATISGDMKFAGVEIGAHFSVITGGTLGLDIEIGFKFDIRELEKVVE